jgi:hypothetical protein
MAANRSTTLPPPLMPRIKAAARPGTTPAASAEQAEILQAVSAAEPLERARAAAQSAQVAAVQAETAQEVSPTQECPTP